MKRIARILWRGSVIVSLVLWLAIGILWVRGHWIMDEWEWKNTVVAPIRGDPGREFHRIDYKIRSWDGEIFFSLERETGDEPGTYLSADGQSHVGVPSVPGRYFSWSHEPIYSRSERMFDWGHSTSSGSNHTIGEDWVLYLPDWLFFLMFGVLPMVWLVGRWRSAMRRWRRQRLGLCVACGYDLRGSPDRCPECGRVREKLGVSEG